MLWSSLIHASLCLAVAALPPPVRGEEPLAQLTASNFTAATAEGAYVVEFFSPWCGHCTQFEPTWRKLVHAKAATPGLHLAQVNCVTQADLCDKNGIKGYPTIKFFSRGKEASSFNSDRQLSRLIAWIDEHFEEPAKQPGVNPDGQVLELDPSTFPATARGLAFVKFYAPWCGHCQKLAPVWSRLAERMIGSATIAEVNCDKHTAFCKAQGVDGYPMMFLYRNGGKVEYSGRRTLEALEQFLQRAISPTIQIRPQDLDRHLQKEPVVYLLLYSSDTQDAVITVEEAAKPLLGNPPVLKSNDLELYRSFQLQPSAGAVLLVLKDHQSSVASSISVSSTTAETLTQYLQRHQFPTLTELSMDNFATIMKSAARPLVVLTALDVTSEDFLQQKDILFGLASKWHRVVANRREARDVVFVWMDAHRWGKWLKSMYGISGGRPTTVIVDHSQLLYYDRDVDGSTIGLTSETLFSAIKGVLKGVIKPRHSENLLERMARALNSRLESIGGYISTHTKTALFWAAISLFIIFLALRRCVEHDLPQDYIPPKHTSRLD